jgi:DNA polymerase V
MHGRMFGEDTGRFAVIEAAIASLTARAAAQLRDEHLLARGAALYVSTNRHKPGYQQVNRFINFDIPTADTGILTSRLVEVAEAAFNPRLDYHRANILLYDLISEKNLQTDLFNNLDLAKSAISQTRLQAFDSINARYGRRTIRYAAEDLSAAWEPKHNHRSPRYTTAWTDLPTAHIPNDPR